jgi:hypothetical protein
MRFAVKITDQFILEPILHTLGVKPDSSYVELGEKTLEVRMGIWFDETVPLSQIARIAPSDWPWWGGLGVKLIPHGVGVIGSLDGVVNLQLEAEREMRVLFNVKASQLAISVEDRDGFLAALSKATGLPISPHVPFSLKG